MAADSRHSLSAVLASLAGAGVEFVVCGGVACIAHGVARTTADLDCCVRLDEGNLRRLIAALSGLGFRLRAPEPLESLADAERRLAWIAEKQAMVATLVSEQTPLQVDVFLRYPIPYEELAAGASLVEVGGVQVRLSSKEHLLRAKREVHPQRLVDRRDIVDLEELIRRDESDRRG